jgi:hypothetical protein
VNERSTPSETPKLIDNWVDYIDAIHDAALERSLARRTRQRAALGPQSASPSDKAEHRKNEEQCNGR